MTSVNVTENKYSVSVTEGATTVVTAKAPGPQGATGAAGAGISAGDKGALTVAANLTDWTLNKPIDLNDNEQIRFGDSQDLQIFHNGSVSIIKDNGTGGLRLSGENTIALTNAAGTENYGRFLKNGAVELFFDAVKKAETTATGFFITGNLTVSGNMTVSGTTTTINSTTLTVEDKNIELGKVGSPTDITADGGGITLLGDTNHTFNWLNATDSWTSSEHIALPDNKKLQLGDSQDLQIFHNGSFSVIMDNGTGGLALRGENTISMGDTTGNRVYLQAIKDGAVSLRHNNVVRCETSANGFDVTGSLTCTGNLNLPDSTGATVGRIMLGDGTDLQISHTGSAGIIGNYTGTLGIRSNALRLQNGAGTESYLQADENGAVELYFDNALKFTTKSFGATAFGTLTANGGDIKTINSTSSTDTNSFLLANSTGNALQVTHTSSNSYIKNLIGSLFIEPKSGETGIKVIPDGAVELYHDATKKAETTATGFYVTGNLTCTGNLDLPDDSDILLGDNDEFRIFHDESNGLNYIQAHNNGPLIFKGSSGELAKFVPSGEVSLRHNGSTKLETTSTGITVTGGAVIGGSATFAADGYFTTTSGITISNSQPGIIFEDTGANPDFIIQNRDGFFAIRDITNAANRFLVNMANGDFTVTGSILPEADNTDALGSSSKRFTTLHSAALNTGDINMSNLHNEGNEVDGSKGSWTLQEGADDLFIINRVSGKKYKFNLTEIS